VGVGESVGQPATTARLGVAEELDANAAHGLHPTGFGDRLVGRAVGICDDGPYLKDIKGGSGWADAVPRPATT
jgi:hypothetical protein